MHSELLFARRDWLGSALRLFACLLAAVGCNPYAQQEASSTSGTGGLGLQLKLSAEVTVTSITYQLLQGSELVRSGTFVPSPERDAFAGFVGGLPQATGYNLSLESNALLVDSRATTRCSGKASFGIVRGKTTTVAVRMRCEGVRGDELTPQTTPAGNHCPSISLLLAQPSTANLGEAIGLQGEALDPDMLPKPLSFRWSTPNGVGKLSSALDAVTSFVCTSAGGAELVLVVSDGDAACPFESSSVKVTCTASTDPKPAAGVGASAPVGPQPAGAQAPANTSGQGSSGASMTAQRGPRAGQGSAHTWPPPPPSGGNGASAEPPAFDAGAPPIDPPSRDGEDDEEVPPPSDPQDSEPPGHDDGDLPPSWPGADAGQSPERDRGDIERDAGAQREGRNDRNRDGGRPREGGGEGGRRGPRTEAPAPDPGDAADAGASDEGPH